MLLSEYRVVPRFDIGPQGEILPYWEIELRRGALWEAISFKYMSEAEAMEEWLEEHGFSMEPCTYYV